MNKERNIPHPYNIEPHPIRDEAYDDIIKVIEFNHARKGVFDVRTGEFFMSIELVDLNNVLLPVRYRLVSVQLSNESVVRMFTVTVIGRPILPKESK